MQIAKLILFSVISIATVALSSNAYACGEYCGLFDTTGYSGYGLGSSMYDIYSYSSSTNISVTVDTSSYGGCGSFTGSCGYVPTCGTGSIDFGPSLYGESFGNPYASSMNPYSFTGNGQFVDPQTQMLMMSTMGMPMDPSQMTNIFSMMGPQMFPGLSMNPGMSSYPFPAFNPGLGYQPNMLPNIFSNTPPTSNPFPTSFPTTTLFDSPIVNTGTVVPPTTAPTPLVPSILAQPPSPILPWAGCDNVIVMCTASTVTRPPDVTVTPVTPTPVTPTISGTPNYVPLPVDPTRYTIPRTTH